MPTIASSLSDPASSPSTAEKAAAKIWSLPKKPASGGKPIRLSRQTVRPSAGMRFVQPRPARSSMVVAGRPSRVRRARITPNAPRVMNAYAAR